MNRRSVKNMNSALERFAGVLQRNLPDIIKPVLREVSYRVKKNEDLIGLEAEARDLTQQWRTIAERSLDINEASAKSAAGQHVLFVTGFGVGTGVWTQQPVLMMALRQRGCRISSLYCDMGLPACEFNPAGNHNPCAGRLSAGLTRAAKTAMCRRCAKNVRETYSFLPVELYSYRRYIKESDLQAAEKISCGVPFDKYRDFEYAGIRLGEEVFASVLRATFKGTVADTPLNRLMVNRYLLSGIIMCRMAERAFQELAPDRIAMPHGVYLNHGVANKVANKLKIPVIVYPGFGGIRKNTIMLSPGETYHRSLTYEDNTIWDKVSITDEQRQKTLAYALSKQSGGVDVVNYHPKPIEDRDYIYKALNIDGSRAVITLFTNVIWDAQIYYDGNAFENILEWMFSSIEELGKNDKVWAVIRIHPAEVKGGLPTNQPFLQEIKRRFPVLPDNFRIIPPEDDISSYTLAELSRAVIIYGTKLGLELAVRGIPVVVCGECFSRNKGYSIDITSKQQYFSLLKNIHTMERLDKSTIERALKYAYYLYFRRMIPFPYIQTDPVTQRKRIALSKLEDLDAGKDPDLDAICDSIMRLTPPYAP